MKKVTGIKIKCGHCGVRGDSPIGFTTESSFNTISLIGAKYQCPSCQEMMHCNKENLSIIYDDGTSGEVGDNFAANKA